MASWDRVTPVFSIFCITASLPARRIMAKDKKVMASKMGISCKIRLRA